MLWPEMLQSPGHLLVWSLLLARWMTPLLDCGTIRANQALERNQTANQLLEHIGPHYRARPIAYLALFLLYLVHFPLCLPHCWTLILSSVSSPHFFFLEKQWKSDKIPEKKEWHRRDETRTSAPLSFGWPARIPAHIHNRSLKTPWDYYSSLFLWTDVTGKEQSPSSLNISARAHKHTEMYTYTQTHTLNTDSHDLSCFLRLCQCIFICHVSTSLTGQSEVTRAYSFLFLPLPSRIGLSAQPWMWKDTGRKRCIHCSHRLITNIVPTCAFHLHQKGSDKAWVCP